MLASLDNPSRPISGAPYVHDTAVDVAKLFEAEKPRAVCGVIEDEGLCTCKSEFSQCDYGTNEPLMHRWEPHGHLSQDQVVD